MTDWKVLNLYAGIGGNRKLWDGVKVTAIEINPNIAKIYGDFFPDDEVIIAEAHQFLLENFKDYDFIWASPPCPTHSKMRRWMAMQKEATKPVYPDMKLYEEIIFLDSYFKGKYCVENVASYYAPLIRPQEIGRHYYWSNFIIRKFKPKETRVHYNRTWQEIQQIYGFDISKYDGIDKRKTVRNCVEPEVGKIILESARGETQSTLSQFNEDFVHLSEKVKSEIKN